MIQMAANDIIAAYLDFIRNQDFPCVAAKAALADNHIHAMVADHLGCPKDDERILKFLYEFIEEFRVSGTLYHSAVIIFTAPGDLAESDFDQLLWRRLQAISDLDALHARWDVRVKKDTSSPDFSFSIGEEAFYVIGLHANSSRRARQFRYASLVFNPHQQFEMLRKTDKYLPMKKAVRKRDIRFSGSVNPMLADFGESSEVFQYSGIRYDNNWKCPFVAKHPDSDNDPAS
jgi:FPC/CPF motif-containing protein YcgG